jgi:tetratricopeptide (TPR) repeat protein
MSKSRRRPISRRQGPKSAPADTRTPDQLRRYGLRSLNAGRYAAAIEAWQRLDLADPALPAALAEAHFRQAVSSETGPDAVDHLRQAIHLAPGDPIYTYHLGLALHKQGQIAEALDAYRQAVANGLAQPGSGQAIGLAALELDPQVDLATVPGVSDEDREALEPAIAWLRGTRRPSGRSEQAKASLSGDGDLQEPDEASAAQTMLLALERLAAGEAAEAQRILGRVEDKALAPEASARRWYYLGVAAAQMGNTERAVKAWERALRIDPGLTRASDNLAAIHAQEAAARAESADWDAVLSSALAGLNLSPGNAALSVLALRAIDERARAAAQADDWPTAVDYWEQARWIASASNSTGSPRPILHNLALAYEAIEEWDEAAEAWRAMLRTKPRKRTLEYFTDDHWAWVRKRVVACYKEAGNLQDAIGVLRQALKADPDDVDVQFDLANALAANEQEQAAINELIRLLERHPQHVPAMVFLAELYAEQNAWYAVEKWLERALHLEPDNPELRKHMTQSLLQHAAQMGYWDAAVARAFCEKALQYTPDDHRIYLQLAALEYDANHRKAAYGHMARALDLSAGKPEVVPQIFHLWITMDRVDEARNLLAQVEANGPLSADVYVRCSIISLEKAFPPPAGFGLGMLFGPSALETQEEDKADPELLALGEELLERATALDLGVHHLRQIVMATAFKAPHIAIPYARRLMERTPDDIMVRILLAVALVLDKQHREARQLLQQAERLARKQGDLDTAYGLKHIRDFVNDPRFPILVRMSPLFEDVFDDAY